MNRILTLFGLMIAGSGMGLANGGGYSNGGVEKSGSIEGFEPKQTEKVQILDEQLTITLGPKSAEVEVRYLMKNVSKSKAKVRFGFPVEVTDDNFYEDLPDPSGTRKPKNWQAKVAHYCSGYQVTAFGKALKAEFEAEKRQEKDQRFDGIAGWMVSEFQLDPGVEMPMRIRYLSTYPYSYYGVSDDDTSSYGNFNYRLSTAACWAGPIARGRIVIKSRGIRADEVKIIKPVNRFRKVDGGWEWSFENLEPTLADDITIEPLMTENSYYRYEAEARDRDEYPGHYVQRGERWFLQHAAYAVEASSTLPAEGKHRYDASQLKEHHQGVWSEGSKGAGVGEWLELVPEVAKPLDAILILPGYFYSDPLFAANARPKKIKVELNADKAFEVDVPDNKQEFRIFVDGYDKPVSKIRLTFLEVWPGTKYEDLCLSGIRLKACLEKEPKIQPAR